ncbi:hypothetical protein WUBG_09880 [Wuchereria bancrofti]|uniref:Uncharacterized protein n=1 Tax=Wuchereria bancrofti TaxID=6293 RepID=J9EAN4_WUCBA|nr:hypothetical protein WUBG_09880 [Wuchereria bancrofti]
MFMFYNIWKHKREPLKQPPYYVNGYTLQITRNQLPSMTTVCYHSPVVGAFCLVILCEKSASQNINVLQTLVYFAGDRRCTSVMDITILFNGPACLRSMCVFPYRIRKLDTCILLCQCTVHRNMMGYRKRSTYLRARAGIDWMTVSAASSYIHPVMSEEAEEFPHQSIGRISDVTHLEQPHCSQRGAQQGSARCVLPALKIPN